MAEEKKKIEKVQQQQQQLLQDEEEEGEEAVADERKEGKSKEGHLLLGSPTFTPLENGRFRCNETGHEMPAKDMESYGRSKCCRTGLIDAFLRLSKAPLNSFSQHPLFKSKLICKLTGDTINKSEEHIWKHINGKRFQNKLEQKEAEKAILGVVEKKEKSSHKASKSSTNVVKKDVKGEVGKTDYREKEPVASSSESEEPEFWMPPVGSRWDFDDGNDRWGSCSNSDDETNEGLRIDEADKGDGVESEDLSTRTKRMSIAIGPSSFASRKKKKKTESTCNPNGN